MTEADLDQVIVLETEAFPEPWSRSAFRAALQSRGSCCLVAETAGPPGSTGRLAGYAVTWPEESEFHLANIAVRPEARRRGIGSALLATVLEQARCTGAMTLSLEVRETNIGALAFYRRYGLIITGFRRGYYPDGETAAIMEREV